MVYGRPSKNDYLLMDFSAPQNPDNREIEKKGDWRAIHFASSAKIQKKLSIISFWIASSLKPFGLVLYKRYMLIWFFQQTRMTFLPAGKTIIKVLFSKNQISQGLRSPSQNTSARDMGSNK